MTDRTPDLQNEKVDPTNTKPGRRRLLKALAGGGGALAVGASLPEKWNKPAIRSVLLPAHAQTTAPVPDPDPDPVTVMSCQVQVNEGTGGEAPSQLFTADGTTQLGCGDGGVGTSLLQTTVLEDGVPVPGLEVELTVVLTGLFGGGGFTGSDTQTTDGSGVASGFDFGGGNAIFQINGNFGPPYTAEFCYTVINRPDILPCCILVSFECPAVP